MEGNALKEHILPSARLNEEAEEVAVLVRPADALAAKQRARDWADRLGLPMVEPQEARPEGLHLVPTEKGLELWAGAQRRQGIGRVDFTRRAESGPGAARQPLHRAIGKRPATVVDATAGFGDDAIALAGFGHHVLALEQSPIVAALLEESRRRAEEDPNMAATAGRLQIECADARLRLPHLPSIPDVVYLDPMYSDPPRKSRALPRIEIQLLRRLVGRGDDGHDLFEAALQSGARRIVIKRPIQAPALMEPWVAQHEGKLARYDVYDSAAFETRTQPKPVKHAAVRSSE